MTVLVAAWHAIRRNAETSQQETTKQSARKFGEDLPRNLASLQRRLQVGYTFKAAHGATPPKGPGKTGKRPIVVAPLEDRIVQRAILDVLQQAKELLGVQRVLQTATSIGGIPGRGVDHAIALFDQCARSGDTHVAGSDIAGFFTKIPRAEVIDFLRADGAEADFVSLVEKALTVELSNSATLSAADRELFPIGPDGVAQGCPLSALAGNIVLEQFDREMNQRGITCIRYIDDFILIGKSKAAVEKAMEVAQTLLSKIGMDIYRPKTSPNKAFVGPIGQDHTFLGYKLIPNKYPPSDGAIERFKAKIRALIAEGQKSIGKATADRALRPHDRCYAQTLVAIDHTVRGWRGSFGVSDCPEVFSAIDKEIDRMLSDFRAYYLSKIAKKSPAQQRRAVRVALLVDGTK